MRRLEGLLLFAEVISWSEFYAFQLWYRNLNLSCHSQSVWSMPLRRPWILIRLRVTLDWQGGDVSRKWFISFSPGANARRRYYSLPGKVDILRLTYWFDIIKGESSELLIFAFLGTDGIPWAHLERWSDVILGHTSACLLSLPECMGWASNPTVLLDPHGELFLLAGCKYWNKLYSSDHKGPRIYQEFQDLWETPLGMKVI